MTIGLEEFFMHFAPPRDGMVLVCTIPRELGVITGLNVVRGRLIASTSAGIPFVVPRPPEQVAPSLPPRTAA